MTASRVLPAATSLLARKRLADAVEALTRKTGGGNYDVGFGVGTRQVRVRNTEREVLAMATAALAQLGGGAPVDLPATTLLHPGPGRFAILGTAAFDLPAYADVLGGNRGWIAQTLRTGNPDPHRSPIVAPTSALATAFAARARADGVDPALSAAFAHGIVDAAATGIALDPVLAGTHARRSTADWRPLDPSLERVHAEARALRLVAPDGRARWSGFWPGARDVPDALLASYVAAATDLHHLGAGRATGFPSFESALRPGAVPTAAELKAAYGLLRLDLLLSGWSGFDWWAFLLPLWAMPSISLIIARELPGAEAFFGSGSLDDAAFTEVLSLGTGLASLTPFVWSMLLWSQVPDRTGVFVEALLLFLARAGLTTAFAATTEESSDGGIRWGVLLPLLGADLYALVRGIIDLAGHRTFDGFVRMLQTIPAASGLLTMLLALLAKGFGVSSDGGFWAYWTVVTVVMLLLGIPIAAALTGSGLRNILLAGEGAGLRPADAVRALSDLAITDPSGPALAFDDSTLWADGGGDAPGPGDLRYPSGRRELVRIWYDGVGSLTISHDAHVVTLRLDGAATPVPVARSGLTATALAAAIQGALPGVHTEVVDPLLDPELPWPRAIGDLGDDRDSTADHDAHVGDAAPVGTTRERAYVLRQAPLVHVASSFGATALSGLGADDVPLVPERGLADLEQTALGVAADLAVLLHLGLSTAIAPVTPPATAGLPALPALGRSFEVFRHWNLDRRRVNEWRMLVLGGAESEKAGHPELADPGMLAGRPAANASPAGAAIADAMGWLPLWRSWLRMAADLTADSTATAVMPYTPIVRRADGTSFQPTNADLTNGVRFLLDLP